MLCAKEREDEGMIKGKLLCRTFLIKSTKKNT